MTTARTPTPWRVDTDKMLSRVFVADATGKRIAESLVVGTADKVVALTARVAELEAALRQVSEWVQVVCDEGVNPHNWNVLHSAIHHARAALAKATKGE
jgi:hypothetical protein